MTGKDTRKYAIYSRKSKFTGKGESIDNQITRCKEYLKFHYDIDDEDSIICEFEVIRDPIHEQNVSMTWINPNGEISRARDMVIPAGDTSAYDYRYLEGRETGKWSFKILYNQKEYTTQFDLKK